MSLGGLVRGFRMRAGLTQQKVADLAGLSVAGLRDVEQGRVTRPRVSTLRRLAGAFRLSAVETEELMRAGVGGSVTGGLWIGVLGPLRVTVEGEEIDPGSETQRLLLGLLALSPNAVVGRDTLVEGVWGPRPPVGAADLLQSRISRLRRRLREDGSASAPESSLVVAARGGYQLRVEEDQHDVLTFRRLVARARRSRQTGEIAEAAEIFGGAVRLWRGEPLGGLPVLATDPAVVGLLAEWQQVVCEYAQVAAELGRFEEVVPHLRRITDADPLHEAAHAQLMIALAGCGQQAAALTIFDKARHRLADELGADPGPDLTNAYQRVLHQDVARPEFAPVSVHRQMPPDIADFSGRDGEVRALFERLPVSTDASTGLSLVTIEGMGGVGKTRLAVHLAHRLLAEGRYADHQLYVDLRGHADQPPADPSAVLACFLHLLGVPGQHIPPGLDERAALYRDRLYGKNALVLLDDAADESQIAPLLPAGPSNFVLITSRHALALDGAHSLSLDVFTSNEARELLANIVGVGRVEADPDATDDVIRLCGHLPLAIALVARRMQSRTTWTMADLAQRLRHTANRLDELAAGTRQLRAVFDLSYRALERDERRVFDLLGLYPEQNFTADSVAALADLDPLVARRHLDRLVDKHVIGVASGDRYCLHDLFAEYARHVAHTKVPAQQRRAAVDRVKRYLGDEVVDAGPVTYIEVAERTSSPRLARAS